MGSEARRETEGVKQFVGAFTTQRCADDLHVQVIVFRAARHEALADVRRDGLDLIAKIIVVDRQPQIDGLLEDVRRVVDVHRTGHGCEQPVQQDVSLRVDRVGNCAGRNLDDLAVSDRGAVRVRHEVVLRHEVVRQHHLASGKRVLDGLGQPILVRRLLQPGLLLIFGDLSHFDEFVQRAAHRFDSDVLQLHDALEVQDRTLDAQHVEQPVLGSDRQHSFSPSTYLHHSGAPLIGIAHLN